MRFAMAIVTLFSLLGGLDAQVVVPPVPDRFKDTTPAVLEPGEQLHIRYSNPDMKNKTITVTIKDVGDEANSDSVTIHTDDQGKGEGTFNPPSGWEGVTLKHPTSQDHVVPIDG